MIKRSLVYCLSIVFLLFCIPIVHAEDFKTDYKVDYFLNDSSKTKVQFHITITSFTSESYIKKFSLGFPKLFTIQNVHTTYNGQEVIPTLSTADTGTRLSLEFPQPFEGKGNVTDILIDFDQSHLFTINGNVWEVMLPTLSTDGSKNYQLTIHLPENTDKKLSVSKPPPSAISGKEITWNNPTTKIVYAVFGDTQLYKTKLVYHLENPKINRVYTDIALPPDTLYQKVYIDSLDSSPSKVFQDEDGNLLARYTLQPKEKKDILFEGVIAEYANPREEVIPLMRKNMSLQSHYLLDSNKYWGVYDDKKLHTVADIYSYITNSFKYDYSKLTTQNDRLGANKALSMPDKVVCTEFSDTFIALARKQGIYSREIEGYGVSNDQQLRPLSIKSDILHSWPEYYDESSQLWKAIDPTWQNTSGIDYFNSFDLNHITFAIHAKDPEYPYPAGTYKSAESRDVTVETVNTPPQEHTELTLQNKKPFSSTVVGGKKYTTTLQIQNNGSVYMYNIPISIEANDIVTTKKNITIDSIAPFETKELPITYESVNKNNKKDTSITISINGSTVLVQTIAIVPFYYQIAKYSFTAVLIVGSIVLVLKFLTRKRHL